jgi:hypothetical protein
MPIPITCEACQRQYKVDDKLTGKKLKCKGCGQLIRVPGTAVAADESQECLSCGSPLASGSRICPKCGFNLETGQKESLLLEDETEALKARKKRRWQRPAGSSLLESLDELIKLIVLLGLVAGIVVTVVHIVRSPAGISLPALVPAILVLAAIGAIMAPAAALAVNLTVKAMKLAPRDDTYVRAAVVMLVPFACGLLLGWPETAENWEWVARLGWPAAILLLIYFFRADVIEWVTSVAMALAAMGLSVIVVILLGGAVNDMAGGLYGDMLPAGPWTVLAKGHSPEPPPAPPAMTPSTRRTPTAETTSVTEDPTTGPTVAAPREVGSATTPAVVATVPAAGVTTAVAPRPVAVKMTSPFFTEVIENDGLRDAAAVVAPAAAGGWMLTVKNTETTTEVDRWALNPLEKKEHFSYPYFARKIPQFAISPKGDALAALSFFPRRQLEVMAFDGKTAKRTIALDVQANVPEGATQAVPALLGVADAARFYLRWDMNGASVAQVFAATGAGTPGWRAVAFGPAVEAVPAAVSPNGRTAAVFGKNQINFANFDFTPPPRPILIASDLDVRLLGLTFSPDGSQLAVYAAVADLPTVMCYQVSTGDRVCTNLLSQTPVPKNAEARPHALVWLAGSQAWLIDGDELADAATGKKIASLGLSGVADQQPVGAGMVAFTFRGDHGPHTILAKMDDAKIRAAREGK